MRGSSNDFNAENDTVRYVEYLERCRKMRWSVSDVPQVVQGGVVGSTNPMQVHSCVGHPHAGGVAAMPANVEDSR